nr:M43 family zinc metalloprotease [uncultured Dyadobacter sp.]
MKALLRLGSCLSVLLLSIGFWSCETQVEQSLDEYYPLRGIKEIVIDELPKTDYFLGMEEVVIPLQAKAYDASGKQLKVPENLVHFTKNGEIIDGAELKIKVEGTYWIVAHIGKIQSDTLKIRTLDPSKLSLHIWVDPAQQEAFIADGKAKLDFKVSLSHNGTAVPLSSEFELYCNNEVVTAKTFATKKAGKYKFKASGANLSSNEINIEALSQVKTLRLSRQSAEPYFFGFDVSSTSFLLEGLDAANQPVPLSEDIKLFKGASEIDQSAQFKARDLGKVSFQAKGYKIESNVLAIDVMSPVKTLKLGYTQHGNTFWADGNSEISFSLKAFDFNGKEITPTADVKLYQGTEVVDFTRRFTTRRSGNLVFQAKGFNSESEEITVRATAPVNFRTVRIPVIFHEVNTTKLTQAKIDEVLDGVTKSFRKQWNPKGGPKDPNAADLFIEVYAAERDPSGNLLPIRGLNRVSSGKQSFMTNNTQRLNEAERDAMNHYWPSEQYFNIWVYSNIKGDLAGYSWAYFPETTLPLEGLLLRKKGNRTRPDFAYGAFINADHLGPGDGVEVTAHEMGHALALDHVFDGNMGSHYGCSNRDSDFCEDTKPYDRKAYENNIQVEQYSRKGCDGSIFTSTNIMDYHIGYENSFTVDQRSRVRHAIDFCLWLPTPFNNFQNGRIIQNGKIEKPEAYQYRTPIACHYSGLTGQKMRVN